MNYSNDFELPDERKYVDDNVRKTTYNSRKSIPSDSRCIVLRKLNLHNTDCHIKLLCIKRHVISVILLVSTLYKQYIILTVMIPSYDGLNDV